MDGWIKQLRYNPLPDLMRSENKALLFFVRRDLLSSLDSLSSLGFTRDEPQIDKALEWLITRQKENGLWELKLLKAKSDKDLNLWIGLVICRLLKRFYK